MTNFLIFYFMDQSFKYKIILKCRKFLWGIKNFLLQVFLIDQKHCKILQQVLSSFTCQNGYHIDIMCTPPPSLSVVVGRGGLNLHPNFQKEGALDRTSTFTGGCWERGGDFFDVGRGREGQGGAIFT